MLNHSHPLKQNTGITILEPDTYCLKDV